MEGDFSRSLKSKLNSGGLDFSLSAICCVRSFHVPPRSGPYGNMKSTKNGIITADFMGEFDRSMKPSNIIENTAMRYSAAYPMGAERVVFRG